MTSDSWTRAKRLLSALLEADPEDPEAWLKAHTDDPELRSEVRSLFSARTDGFLEESALSDWLGDVSVETISPLPSPPPDKGKTIGDYRLIEEIGLGGMSVVYRAERIGADFEQTVAVKLLQRRLHTDDADQRFRAERQLLARLDHPHIAALVDGGVTEGGRPYLVMEFVDGTPITTYAHENELDLPARLDLLSQVLDAVQAAHRQLVVHRDLKPSNVMVTELDGRPHVKLLDFGIAKLLDESAPVTRPLTRTGHALLTPSYAAPEQIVGDDITTATDVYQVAVLAYELMTGHRPLEVADERPSAVERILTEEDPVPPSERTEGSLLSPESIRGDLDRIILKALRKDPERRYRSMEALIADLDRYRSGQPITARPATLSYRAKKFLDRNRTGVGVAAFLTLLVAGFIGVLVWQQQKTAQQRDRARREAKTAEQVSTYLTTLFERADPHLSQGDTVTARELLREGMNRIDNLDGQPLVQAELLYVLGRTRRRIGLYDSTRALLHRALEIRRQELGQQHPKTAELLKELALWTRDAEGDYAEAESLFTKEISIRRATQGPRHESVAEALKNLVYLQRHQEKLEEARASIQKALSIQRAKHGNEHMSVAESLYNLAAILLDENRYEKAEQIQRKSLALCQKLTEGPHPGTAANLNNLAILLDKQGEYEEAAEMYRRALSMKQALYDPPHPEVATTLSNLAQALQEQGAYKEAEESVRRALRMKRALYGPSHPKIAADLVILGEVLFKQNHFAPADSTYTAARTMLRDEGRATTSTMVTARTEHAQLHWHRRRYSAAADALKKALSLERRLEGPDHAHVRGLQSELADLYREWGRPEAAARYDQSQTSRRRGTPIEH